MTVLTAQQKLIVVTDFYNRVSAENIKFGAILKADHADSVTALDNFFESNIVAINNAFPEPMKSVATPREKAILLIGVIRQKYGV